MLQKRPEDLEAVKDALRRARLASARDFEDKFRNTITNFDFPPGSLVLVRNSKLDSAIGYKTKPRYVGPMLVVRRTEGGSYILSELNGSISRLRYAAYRIIPYMHRNLRRIPVTTVTALDNEALEAITFDREGDNAPLQSELLQRVATDVVLARGELSLPSSHPLHTECEWGSCSSPPNNPPPLVSQPGHPGSGQQTAGDTGVPGARGRFLRQRRRPPAPTRE
ncbi:hypothetical protein FA15DRAFT_606633 [Coprinopsis marcescibilis]|uniref:Uncharacterized protein n=1 Tax=Coprinopsis marcescibilis TaxID=230819 RepID=A0A5C3K9D0_COPMA|nr:hypothetical protein FA15DRAFT_606633 [Coprinopsis marcescibilis]